MSACFSKQSRLLKKYQFIRVVRRGKRYAGNFLLVECLENRLNRMRLGLTVSRKFGKAVKRNAFKRLVREAFRSNQVHLSKGVDIHVKPRLRAKEADRRQIQNEFNALLRSAIEFF